MLEHHSHVAADPVDLADLVGEFDVVDGDHTLLVGLEAVDAADQRGFSRAGRPADDDPRAALDGQGHVVQHLEGAIPLVHIGKPDGRHFRHDAGRSSRRLFK